MGNPANFGMAKSLFGSVGGLEPGTDRSPDGLAALIRGVEDLPPEVTQAILHGLTGDDADDEPAIIGPVRLPGEEQRREAARTAPVLRQLRLLAEYCAPPGRLLTGKGNLRLADARHLVVTLDTGDDPELGGSRTLQSAEELPALSRLVHLALEAGVVRRKQGRLVAVARFAGLDDIAAHEKVVRAAVVTGLSGPPGMYFPALEPVRAVADECVIGLLADLLDAGAGGIESDALIDIMAEFIDASFTGLPDFVAGLIPGWVQTQLERLQELGVATTDGGSVALTAAGVQVAIGLVQDAGVEVLLRPDPTTSDAVAIADLLGSLDAQDWTGDASAWLVAQPDPVAAVRALIDELCEEHRDPITVMIGITVIGELAGDDAVAAVREQLGGPHDGLVLHWLAARSAIDPSAIDPVRFVSGLVDIIAMALDAGGPQEAVASFSEPDQDQQLELLDGIWRLDHPRLPDVLEAIGAHHPAKVVGKAARKALVRHRSRLASVAAR